VVYTLGTFLAIILLKMIRDIINYFPPINKEGFVFIGICIVVTMLLFGLSRTNLGWIALIITLWCISFFRDPERVTPEGDDYVISAADGRVDQIVEALPPVELNMGNKKMTRVSVFLSVFDVHVNRIPVSGTIKALHYHPGQFVSATLDKSSELNERQSVLIETKSGKEVAVVQIAGLIARRIVCNLDEKQTVNSGERYGIIRFGSRVDIYLPKGVEPQVYVGQYMIGGETVIAKLTGEQNEVKTKKHKK
jgi:phosphatidylserine decarboxylase